MEVNMNQKNVLTVIIPLVLGCVFLAACSGGSGATVSGTIILPDGETVPGGSTIKVQVQDTSLADAPATTMGEETIEGNGQTGSIDFSVEYNPDEIVDNHTYTMNVRIEDAGGSLLFINDTSIRVITNDNPTENVQVPVIAVGR
jgi:putative lipoprotein